MEAVSQTRVQDKPDTLSKLSAVPGHRARARTHLPSEDVELGSGGMLRRSEGLAGVLCFRSGSVAVPARHISRATEGGLNEGRMAGRERGCAE